LEPPPPLDQGQPDGVAGQLAKTAADLRVLGEQLGAIPRSAPIVVTPRRMWLTFALVVALAALGAWFLWAEVDPGVVEV